MIPANMIVRRRKSVKACTSQLLAIMRGRFDVSESELGEARHKRWTNRDGLSKHAEFPGKNRGADQMSRNKPPGWTGRRLWYSINVDVTRSETPLCVSETVAVEGTAFSARLTSTRFFGAFFGNSA